MWIRVFRYRQYQNIKIAQATHRNEVTLDSETNHVRDATALASLLRAASAIAKPDSQILIHFRAESELRIAGSGAVAALDVADSAARQTITSPPARPRRLFNIFDVAGVPILVCFRRLFNIGDIEKVAISAPFQYRQY